MQRVLLVLAVLELRQRVVVDLVLDGVRREVFPVLRAVAAVLHRVVWSAARDLELREELDLLRLRADVVVREVKLLRVRVRPVLRGLFLRLLRHELHPRIEDLLAAVRQLRPARRAVVEVVVIAAVGEQQRVAGVFLLLFLLRLLGLCCFRGFFCRRFLVVFREWPRHFPRFLRRGKPVIRRRHVADFLRRRGVSRRIMFTGKRRRQEQGRSAYEGERRVENCPFHVVHLIFRCGGTRGQSSEISMSFMASFMPFAMDSSYTRPLI